MSNPKPKTNHLKETQWRPGVSGNPAGKPKGSKHLSTYIRDMMEDDSFELKLKDGTLLKGTPVQAVVKTLIAKAINGDLRAFDLLARYGYGTQVEIQSNIRPLPLLYGVTGLSDEEYDARSKELFEE